MARAKVLYVHTSGVSLEVLKNLVLAGIRAVLCDDRTYPDALRNTPSLFSLDSQASTVAQALAPAVQDMNPLLGDCQIVTKKELTDEFLAQFSVVIATQMATRDAILIANAVTKAGGKFFLCDTFGMYGACIIDLGPKHTYRPEVGKKLLDPTSLTSYVPIDQILRVPIVDAINRFHKTPPPVWDRYRCIMEYVDRTGQWPTEPIKDLTITTNAMGSQLSLQEQQELADTAHAQVAPVCAVLGGAIGNEVIKCISTKGTPANNTLLFDGISCKCWAFLVQPQQ